jgi:hypothetical protein
LEVLVVVVPVSQVSPGLLLAVVEPLTKVTQVSQQQGATVLAAVAEVLVPLQQTLMVARELLTPSLVHL